MDSCQWHLQWDEFFAGEGKSLGLPLQTLRHEVFLPRWATTNPDRRTLIPAGLTPQVTWDRPKEGQASKKAHGPVLLGGSRPWLGSVMISSGAPPAEHADSLGFALYVCLPG